MLAESKTVEAAGLRAGRTTVLLGLSIALTLASCAGQPEALPDEPSAAVETEAAVDRAVATTGDLITYRVSVDYADSYEVEIPEPGADIAGFRIVDAGREEPRREKGRVIEDRWYKLRADLVGSYILPPVTVGYRPRAEPVDDAAADAGDTGPPWVAVETSAIFVEVESVLPGDGEATDVRDLKELRRIEGPIPWLWIAVGLAAFAALGVALHYYLQYRRRALAVPPDPPHVIAFRALGVLRDTDFGDPVAVRRFYFAISEVLRSYVEGRFGLNATDLTSEEIVAELPALDDLGDDHGHVLERFLADTDRVKFAEHQPSEGEIEGTYENALGFVESTLPVEEPQAEVAA
ncbi:MAG: hypothetical protein WBH85_18600 [Thermoanaerobaculia bacterium]